MPSDSFFGFLASESYSSPAIPKNITAFSSQYKCRSVFLSRIFVSKLKKMKYFFLCFRKLVINYCLGAKLQPEISNVDKSTAGCEVHTKKVESSPFSPFFPFSFCSVPATHAPPKTVLPLRRKRTTVRGWGREGCMKNLGNFLVSEHFNYQRSITEKFQLKTLGTKGNLILPFCFESED